MSGEALFSIKSRCPDTRARLGTLHLPHGDVETPVFMPVGTNGVVKAVDHATLSGLGYRLLLSNTYHLYLRPGLDVLAGFGGLHNFSSWQSNILTDSGGFQIFSLAPFRKIDDDGIAFRSHIDGSLHRLTPESVVQAQTVIGSDILMPLDVCTPPGIDYRDAVSALERTSDWARRSRQVWSSGRAGGSLFGIVQGNFFEDLRQRSAAELAELDLPGYAIGGLSVGEPRRQFRDFLAFSAPLLPDSKPRYVMGIGTPDYILDAVENGIDMFDCVFPTRVARNGMVLTRRGRLVLKKEACELRDEPIDPGCSCPVCSRYSIGYMRHLVKCGEIQAAVFATIHNLAFMADLMNEVRQALAEGRFSLFKAEFLRNFGSGAD
jgi:queuine tRNA-ribosyltransferase